MKRLLILLLFVVVIVLGARFSPIINDPVAFAQTNTFCAMNLACVVTGAWSFSNVTSMTTTGTSTFQSFIQLSGGSCSISGLTTAIAAMAAAGGTVDASACTTVTGSISSTVSIPANVKVRLGPAVWPCNLTAGTAPCWDLLSGAELTGTGGPQENLVPGSQTGTILRCVTTCGSTVNMIGQTHGTTVETVKISDLVIDFNCVPAPAGSCAVQSGQSGIDLGAGAGATHWRITNVGILNPGVDGILVESGSNSTYDTWLVQPFVRSPLTGYGIHVRPVANPSEINFLHIIQGRMQAYNAGDSTTPKGLGCYALDQVNATGGNIGAEFMGSNCEGSVSAAGNGGIVINQTSTSGPIHDIHVYGGLYEDAFNANSGKAFNVIANAGGPGNLFGLDIQASTAHYTSVHNISATNALNFKVCIATSGLLTGCLTDGLIFGNRAAPAANANVFDGLCFFASAAGHSCWGTDSGGIIHLRRVDTAVDQVGLDTGNQFFRPDTDKTWFLGQIGSKNWSGFAGYQYDFQEEAAPALSGAGTDRLYGDNTLHQAKSSYNGLAFFPIPQTGNVSGTHSDSGFYQTAGAAGCTTAASIGGVCATAITITWPVAFADANYKVTCTPIGPATNLPSTPYVVTPIAASVTINYFAITAAAASWPTVNCEAVHN